MAFDPLELFEVVEGATDGVVPFIEGGGAVVGPVVGTVVAVACPFTCEGAFWVLEEEPWIVFDLLGGGFGGPLWLLPLEEERFAGTRLAR